MSQEVSSIVTQYLLDTQPGLYKVLAATAGSDTTRFVHSPAGIHAQENPDGEWMWMVQDGLGSIIGVVDENLNLLENRQYAPYGEVWEQTGTEQSNYQFTGEWVDENDLLYLRARYLNPAIGTFISLDPLETANRYGYVNGNPIGWTDPWGYCAVGDDVCVKAVENLEREYGNILIYWPGRSESCDTHCNPANVPGICSDTPASPPEGNFRTSQLGNWNASQVRKVHTSLNVYSRALYDSEGGSLQPFVGRIAFVVAPSITISGVTIDTAYTDRANNPQPQVCDKYINVERVIYLLSTWQDREAKGDRNYVIWQTVHELGHAVATVAGGSDASYGGLRDKFLLDFDQSEQYSTPYGRTQRASVEPLIEAITGTVWNAAYKFYGLSPLGARSTSVHHYDINVCDVQNDNGQLMSDWIMENVFAPIGLHTSTKLGNCS